MSQRDPLVFEYRQLQDGVHFRDGDIIWRYLEVEIAYDDPKTQVAFYHPMLFVAAIVIDTTGLTKYNLAFRVYMGRNYEAPEIVAGMGQKLLRSTPGVKHFVQRVFDKLVRSGVPFDESP